MKMQEFIKQNRHEIDRAINNVLSFVPKTASCYCNKSGTNHYHENRKLNDVERRLWILNDESLYRWARSEGVKC